MLSTTMQDAMEVEENRHLSEVQEGCVVEDRFATSCEADLTI
jgi:hypothetical protein